MIVGFPQVLFALRPLLSPLIADEALSKASKERKPEWRAKWVGNLECAGSGVPAWASRVGCSRRRFISRPRSGRL